MLFFGATHPVNGSSKGTASGGEKEAFSMQKKLNAPVRKPVCVIHPENAPRTIRDDGFPKDFSLYEYAGATLETVASKGPDGKTVRRPALVAKLVRRDTSEDGASIVVEMTASLRDLVIGGSPHASAIAAALTAFYEEKVPVKEPVMKPREQVLSASPVLTFPANDFFTKMNASPGGSTS